MTAIQLPTYLSFSGMTSDTWSIIRQPNTSIAPHSISYKKLKIGDKIAGLEANITSFAAASACTAAS